MRCIFVIVALMLMLFSADTFAGTGTMGCDGIINSVMCKFQANSRMWSGRIELAATWIFFTLATISFVWTFGLMALKKADLGDILAELIQFIVTIGFFLWLLLNGPDFSIRIINGLLQLAGEASGTQSINPGAIIDMGFVVFERILTATSVWSPIDSLVGLIVGFIVLVILALMAFNMAMLMIAGWFLSYAGIFVLGFGGGRWTSDIAVNYFKTVLGIGIQLFSMVLITAVGLSIIKDLEASMSAMSFTDMAIMLVSALFLLLIVNNVPGLLASPISGGGGAASMGIGNFGAGAAVGAAAALAAATGGATKALESFGAQVGGVGKMLEAAYKQAGNNMDSGAGMFGGAVPGTGMAMGGMFAADMAKNLASGISAEAKSMYSQKMASAKKAVNATFGGRAASQILGNGSDSESSVEPNDSKANAPSGSAGVGAGAGSGVGAGAGGSATGNSTSPADSWMQKEGGFDALSVEEQAHARAMHSEWQSQSAENTYDLDQYVEHTQNQQSQSDDKKE